MTDTEDSSKGCGTVQKDPSVQSPLTSYTKKSKHQWIMLSSGGKDVSIEKYQRKHHPTNVLDVTKDATTSTTSSASKRDAATNDKKMYSEKKF